MTQQVVPILLTIGTLLAKAFAVYLCTILLFPLVSVFQEYKVWKPPNLPSLSLWGMFKVYLFNVVWMATCLIGVILCLPKYAFMGSVEYTSFMLERGVACFLLKTFIGNVQVIGKENLPPSEPGSPAPVYIANHSSQLDGAVVYLLDRRFKWISKSSVLYVPGAGLLMFLSGHVFINRKTGKNKSSVSSLYAKSNAAIQSGIPMFFFPQGTRNLSKQLPFKDGAFNVAIENESTLIPISIDIPTTAWNRVYPLLPWKRNAAKPIIVTVHKGIPVTKETDKEELKRASSRVIYSCLPRYDFHERKLD